MLFGFNFDFIRKFSCSQKKKLLGQLLTPPSRTRIHGGRLVSASEGTCTINLRKTQQQWSLPHSHSFRLFFMAIFHSKTSLPFNLQPSTLLRFHQHHHPPPLQTDHLPHQTTLTNSPPPLVGPNRSRSKFNHKLYQTMAPPFTIPTFFFTFSLSSAWFQRTFSRQSWRGVLHSRYLASKFLEWCVFWKGCCWGTPSQYCYTRLLWWAGGVPLWGS